MLCSAVFRTKDYELHIDKNKGRKGWTLTIYTIKNAVKELYEERSVESYKTAYLYIEHNYLNKNEELAI